MDKVLIIDDEIELSEIIKDSLELEGIEGICCNSGEEAIKEFLKYKPKVVVLDIMLPNINGIDICKEIRNRSKVPIIMLSARMSDTDKILSLGFGADDYVTKPFSVNELVARIKAQIRRYNMSFASEEEVMIFGGISIDKKRHLVKVLDKPIELSNKEFEILYLLVSNKGQVITKERIFEKIWGFNEFGDINTVAVHIKKIREKIDKDRNTSFIKTIWAVGYKFEYEEK